MNRHAAAADRFWVAASNFWEIPANWSATAGGPGGAGQPVVGDNAFIFSNSTINITRDNFSPGYAPPGPALVRLAGSGLAVVTVFQTANANPMAAATLDVGYDGTAQYGHQGAANVVGRLNVGFNAFGSGGVGTYSISGSSTLSVNELDLGFFGSSAGTFNQNGGQVTASTVTLGFNSINAHGYYNLADGTLVVTGNLTVSAGGNSAFAQSGGSAQVSSVLLGSNVGSGAGTLDLSGGSFTAGQTTVGVAGAGAGSLNLGGTGSYRSMGRMNINAPGRVLQSAGTLHASGSIAINGGRYTYNGGTLLLDPGTTLSISGGGTASFNTTGSFRFPNNTGVSVTNGRLELAGFTTFGGNEVGTLLVSGNNASVVATGGTTYFGVGTGGNSTVTFAAGAVGTFDAVEVGNSIGIGTLNVLGGASLTMNHLSAGHGTAQINVSGANSGISLVGASRLRLGEGYAGTMSVSSGAYFFASGGTQTIGRGGVLYVNQATWFSQGAVIIDGGAVSVVNANFFGTGSLTAKNGGAALFFDSSGLHVPHPRTWVLSDALYNVGTIGADEMALFDGRAFTLDGGRLNVGTVSVFGTGEFHFDSGTLDVRGVGGLTIAPGGMLGNELHLSAGKALLVSSITTLSPGSLVALEGGIFSTGSLQGAGSFVLGTGTLRLTIADLLVGAGSPFGSSFQINAGARVEIQTLGRAVVQPGATLFTGGGSMSAAAGVSNSGEIQLGGAGSRISGGSINNAGMLRGSGRIDSSLANTSTGTVRVAGVDSLLFTGPGNTNSGTVQLFGGLLEFQQSLTNHAAGRVIGRGTMIVAGGLTNHGSMTFSGGAADVFGNVTNTATARVLVTGSSETSFYGNVTNQPGSQFRVSDSGVAAFFGTVTGLAAFTGNGTTIFEGQASSGALAAGSSVVESDGMLSAQSVRQAALYLRQAADAEIVNNGTDSGTSKLRLLEIDGAPGAWTGRFNLNDNALVLDYSSASPIGIVRDQIRTARGTGGWAGNGITSLLADAGQFALGYADNADFGFTSFAGQAVDVTSVLTRFTRYGDADLDRTVGISDFALLAANFNTASTWSRGDFNYNGTTEIADFALLAGNFNRSVESFPGAARGGVIPEPATAAAFACIALLGVRRSRGKRCRASSRLGR